MADAPETLDMEVLCMQMIVAAGSAKSDYMEALQAVKAGDYETAAAKMKPRVRPTPPNLQKQSMSCGTR